MLSDNRCTPSLDTIKTNVVRTTECDDQTAEDFLELIFSLHFSAAQRKEEATERELATPSREEDSTQQVNFQESI